MSALIHHFQKCQAPNLRFCIVRVLSDSSKEKEYVEIPLDVARRALQLPSEGISTEREVKAAYRKRAMELHPDRNPESDGKDFKELAKSFEVVLNKAKHDDVRLQKDVTLSAWKARMRKNRHSK